MTTEKKQELFEIIELFDTAESKIKDFQTNISNSSQTIIALPNYAELCAKAQETPSFLQKVE